jgi:hypothetical protein
VNELPEQIEPLLTDIVGVVFTVTDDTAPEALTQPALEVPVTVYEVEAPGVTIAEPLEYVYVLAPLGIIVNELLEQIEPLFTEITGIVFVFIAPEG